MAELPELNVVPVKKGLRGLLSKKITTVVKFMGTDVTIAKLSVLDVLEIQTPKPLDSTKDKVESDKAEVMAGLATTVFIIKKGCEDFCELTDAEMHSFPMGELLDLAAQIMEFSGVTKAAGK